MTENLTAIGELWRAIGLRAMPKLRSGKARAMEQFTVGYYPEIFMKRPYVLARFDSQVDALEAAVGYSRMYYGECSPIIVSQGKKKIHTIPRNAGRS